MLFIGRDIFYGVLRLRCIFSTFSCGTSLVKRLHTFTRLSKTAVALSLLHFSIGFSISYWWNF